MSINNTIKFLILLVTLAALPAACTGGGPPPLAQAGLPTLVFIYTDG
jgi:hypothetical protein